MPVAVIDGRSAGAWRIVGGLTCVARLVRSFELAGVRHVVIVSRSPVSLRQSGARRRRTIVDSITADEAVALAEAVMDRVGGHEVICVDGDLIVDRRIIELLVSRGAPLIVKTDGLGGRAVKLARLRSDEIPCFDGAAAVSTKADWIDPTLLPTYCEEMRGDMPIDVLRVTDGESAKRATHKLIRSTQKHVMDAPARWLDPLVENAIVRLLAPTFVRPNHVTYAALGVGLVAAFLLVRGAFVAAFVLMYLVEWLDGVDGKLARLRLEYSRVGAWESYFDFVYENAWWLALTLRFHGVASPVSGAMAGVALIGGNLLDEIAYTVGQRALGTSLDLLSPWDAHFRLVAGRRNIYVAILLAATVVGRPFAGLVVAGGWAVCTGVVHTGRLGMALARRRYAGERRTPEAGQSDPGRGRVGCR